MPTSRTQIPFAKPVPSALTIASLAAKRIARNRTGRFAFANSCELFVEQQATREMLAEALPRLLDALRLQNVRADTEDHARAATMSDFIFATAPAKPSNSACATIA